MKAYIINLKRSVKRKENILKILELEDCIDYEFIEACDGYSLTEKERSKYFDIITAEQKYGWKILPGEIGCTLSHQKCYKQLIASGLKYVLILEDDIILKEKISKYNDLIEFIMQDNTPTILLLSGLYWFSSKKKIFNTNVVKIIDATMTHSYLINRKAAELLIDERPYIRADDWKYIIQKGVKVLGIKPHIVNQNNAGGSTINIGRERIGFNLYARIKEIKRCIIIRFLTLLKLSEPRD